MSAPTTAQWLRTAVVRVSVGSGRLAVHLAGRTAVRARTLYTGVTRWLDAASGTVDKLFRLALLAAAVLLVRKTGTAIGGWVYRRIESGAWWPLLFSAAGVWIVAAHRVGRPDWKPKKPPTPQPAAAEDDKQPEQAAEQMPAGPPLPSLPDLRISVAKVGTPHAHLAVLAADIGTTPERVREALDKWRIPVEAVRMQGRGTSTGVKGGPACDPALTLRPEDAAVVAAGHPANNNSNNAFETVPDEENPVRTHVVWRDQPTAD